ncbi:MAG: hypothetical protein WCD86_04085 [Ktedonobacteraceae bacterium]
MSIKIAFLSAASGFFGLGFYSAMGADDELMAALFVGLLWLCGYMLVTELDTTKPAK